MHCLKKSKKKLLNIYIIYSVSNLLAIKTVNLKYLKLMKPTVLSWNRRVVYGPGSIALDCWIKFD